MNEIVLNFNFFSAALNTYIYVDRGKGVLKHLGELLQGKLYSNPKNLFTQLDKLHQAYLKGKTEGMIFLKEAIYMIMTWGYLLLEVDLEVHILA